MRVMVLLTQDAVYRAPPGIHTAEGSGIPDPGSLITRIIFLKRMMASAS